MAGKLIARQAARVNAVPKAVADALDASADDLRHDRTEDATRYLKRMDARIADYFARKAKLPGAKKR